MSLALALALHDIAQFRRQRTLWQAQAAVELPMLPDSAPLLSVLFARTEPDMMSAQLSRSARSRPGGIPCRAGYHAGRDTIVTG